MCIYVCVYIYVYTYICTHALKIGLILFPSTVPTCTAFAVLQRSDSAHFWIFLSPVLDRRQSLLSYWSHGGSQHVFLMDMCFPTRHDSNIVKAQLHLEYTLCMYTVQAPLLLLDFNQICVCLKSTAMAIVAF